MKRLAVVAALVMLPSCMTARVAKPSAIVSGDWRSVASRNDLQRLRTWREAFIGALAEARSGGAAATATATAAIAAEGRLLDPDAALDDAAIPVGRYRCRTLKLGSQSSGGLNYVAYQPFACRISMQDGTVLFEKVTGSQRPTGRLYPAGARRQIFLGTLVLGDENRALRYGRDPERDMAGVLERVDASRWRVIFPYPRFESTLDVIELVPAP